MNLGIFARLAALLALSAHVTGMPFDVSPLGLKAPTVVPTPDKLDMTPLLEALRAQGLNATFGGIKSSAASNTIETAERRSNTLQKRVIPNCITFGSTPYQDDCNTAKQAVIDTAMNYDLAPYECVDIQYGSCSSYFCNWDPCAYINADTDWWGAVMGDIIYWCINLEGQCGFYDGTGPAYQIDIEHSGTELPPYVAATC
ncbi:hypothetical protein OIDMADRAFT_34582 [Oidiodendron maius Zn]|uniref:Uncharacterized protein n=1 Tax=Oidiodendron maius (strain Zn) TaxID=913774 RepID=A0A0C3C6P8_OIDMZ|nr:hypothetical protein OIDMADRAFT_34582 [Oidiodendron maius Zn]